MVCRAESFNGEDRSDRVPVTCIAFEAGSVYS